jgi:hypothetical protein
MSQQLIKPMVLIKDTWQTCINTWDTTIRVSAWYVAITIVSAIASFLAVQSLLGLKFIATLIQIAVPIATIYLSVRLYQITLSIEDKKTAPPRDAGCAWKTVTRLLIATLVIALPALLLLGAILTLLIATRTNMLMIWVNLLLIVSFIIGMVYISIRFTFVQLQIIDKNFAVVDAFKYSWNITENKFWAIWGRMFLGSLIFGLLTMIVMLIAISIVGLVSGVDLKYELMKNETSPSINGMMEIVQGIVLACILPLYSIFCVKLFRSVEETKK